MKMIYEIQHFLNTGIDSIWLLIVYLKDRLGHWLICSIISQWFIHSILIF